MSSPSRIPYWRFTLEDPLLRISNRGFPLEDSHLKIPNWRIPFGDSLLRSQYWRFPTGGVYHQRELHIEDSLLRIPYWGFRIENSECSEAFWMRISLWGLHSLWGGAKTMKTVRTIIKEPCEQKECPVCGGIEWRKIWGECVECMRPKEIKQCNK